MIHIRHICRSDEEHSTSIDVPCWCLPTHLEYPGEVYVIHNDRVGMALGLHPAHHATSIWPIQQVINEGPVR